mmetsp:Transcript_76652/g.236805  ORF Transcript_76652/g.236805 Transcript_76652/m.236805 type:complete len:234 (-) Transcript_76652:796-1497(-)
MTQASCQKTTMEHTRVHAESVPQAHRSSSAMAPGRPPDTCMTSSASVHSEVSSISGLAGVSLSQTMPCKRRVTAMTPPRRSARDCAGSISMRMELTKTVLFQPSTPRPRRPTRAGAMRIWESKRAKGSRDWASAASSSRPRSGSPSSKQRSPPDGGAAGSAEGGGSAAPSFAAARATHWRSAERSKARGRADHSTRRPPPGMGFATADSASPGSTAEGSAPAGKAPRPPRVAQ